MIAQKIQQIFHKVPDVIYGYTDISYSSYSKSYKRALVFAVPYEEQLTLDNYTEERFEKSIINAKSKLENILDKIENILKEDNVKYYVPPVAQENEEDLLAEFSFKYAAVNAGLGWIGKNDVLITEKYGPRVRLSVVLINYPFETGTRITESRCASCNKCVDICPYNAIKGKNWNMKLLRDELIDYHLCNKQRSKYIESHGRKNACGLCMIVCPYGINENTSITE